MNRVKKRLEKLIPNEKFLAHVYMGMLLLVFVFSVLNYTLPYERLGFDSRTYVSLTNGWTQVLPDGGKVRIESLPADLDDKPGERVVIRRTLPAAFPTSGSSLFVRSAHQDVVMYIAGEEVYRYSFQAKHNYDSDFPPSQWLVIPMDDSYAGRELELSFMRHQKDGSDTVSEIFLGEKADIIFALVRISLFPLLCGAALFLIGVAFVIRHAASPVRKELGHRNLYIGANLTLISLWMFCNTEVRQLFFQNVAFVRNLEFMTLMLLPIPVILSLNYSERGKYRELAHGLCAVIFVIDLIIMLLTLLGICNFLEVLWLIYLTLAAAALFIFGSFLHIGRTEPELFRSIRIAVFSCDLLAGFAVLEVLNLWLFGAQHRGVLLSLGVICYATGLTIEQSRAQRKLIAQVQQAQMESRAKSDFLASMSHEIRTPINAVLGMDEMILREAKDPAVRSYATDIQHAGKHLLTLINDVLDLSRIESGRMEISEYDYDLPILLEEVTELIRISAEEKGLRFHAKMQSVLPNRLHGDAARIRQIAINLLNNAVKYTKRGRVDFSVDTVSAEEVEMLAAKAVVKGTPTKLESPVYLRMSVRDTGIGIRTEDIPMLFDSFQRLDHERNAGIQGTGLGLAIVSTLVQMMHGCLLVNSVYEIGSQFTVVIPQEKVSGEWFGAFGRHSETQTAQKDDALFFAPEASVLAVDDNAMNRRLLEALLRRTKVCLTTCDSGEACLRLVCERHFDLILMDHLMPEMDGIETLHRLRTLPQSKCGCVPVIVLTANAVAGAKEGYLAEGFSDYLSKPVQSAELEQMMRRYLPREKVRTEPEEESAAAGAAVSLLPDWLYDVGEINVSQGLKFCATEEIYLETLAIYAKNAALTADEIETLRAANDLGNVTVKVHALKSTSRAIGAESLGVLAEKLEMAGKTGDAAAVEAGLDELLDRCRALGEVLAPLAQSGTEDRQADLPELSGQQLLETYRRIRTLADEMEYDRAAAMIESLFGFQLPQEERKRCEKLKQAADGFDWDQIGGLLP